MFKTFDKVLMRTSDTDTWIPEFYAEYEKDMNLHKAISGNHYAQCVRYAGNEPLLFTTDSPKDYTEFKFGDRIEVTDNPTGEWTEALFVGYEDDKNEYPFKVVTQKRQSLLCWKYCRKRKATSESQK